jgi:uroporphyrinogen-III synthase
VSTRRQVLVTRPAERAEPLASRIAALGWEPLLAPALVTELTRTALPSLDRFDALVFTSAAGVRAFAAASAVPDRPAYAVGEATAAAARAAGFSQVTAADGDLVSLNAQLATVPARSLLHVSGEDVAGEVAAPGRTITRVALYRTVAVGSLPDPVCTALYARTVAAACFLSQRTAGAFISLVNPDLCASVRAVVLSASIADAIATIPWARIEIAARPNLDALLERLGAHDA